MTIFSARERASTWRQLWVWLAEAEKELGLPIPDEALEQMRANVVVSDKAFEVARQYEAKFRVSFLLSFSLSSSGLCACFLSSSRAMLTARNSMMSWRMCMPMARYGRHDSSEGGSASLQQ